MEQPFFSIIIPSYNRAASISKAVNSVLAQTFTNWELLVVDDGSTDTTADVIKGFADSRIRYIYQQNAERSAARNNGIKQANGRYICFLDSDDYYLPNHLESFYKPLEAEGFPTLMLFGYNVMDVDGTLTNEGTEYTPAAFRTIEEYLVQHPVRVAAVAIAQEITAKHRFDTSIRIGEDTELWVRIAAEYPIKAIKAFTQAYVIHEGQTIGEKNIASFEGHIATMKKIVASAGNRISGPMGKHVIAYGYFRLAQVLLLCNKRGAAFSALLNSSAYSLGYRFKEKAVMMLACAGLKKYN